MAPFDLNTFDLGSFDENSFFISEPSVSAVAFDRNAFSTDAFDENSFDFTPNLVVVEPPPLPLLQGGGWSSEWVAIPRRPSQKEIMEREEEELIAMLFPFI